MCLVVNYKDVSVYKYFFITSIYSHPARPALPDSPEARLIFNAAERNRTPDGFITRDEMQDIFHVFDENGLCCIQVLCLRYIYTLDIFFVP